MVAIAPSAPAGVLVVPHDVRERGISVIIPAFNEEGAIASAVEDVKKTLAGLDVPFEVIVVNDGSRDRTAEIAGETGARVISHPGNRGYGASLKTGIRHTQYGWIVITDADGTYPIAQIERLVKEADGYDMVVGARTGENVKIPFFRRPAKWLIGKLANYLSGYRIPDLNSGLRLFRREIAERFFTLFPDGFSFTTTITVASMSSDYAVKFVPIDYFKRVGTSSISPLRDFFGFLLLVVRLVTYFKPLNVFLPAAMVLFGVGFAKAIVDLVRNNAFGVGSALVMLAGVQLGFLGLVADLILRRTKL
jgi:glycosyltransferase involved in cell wall biosynthesis